MLNCSPIGLQNLLSVIRSKVELLFLWTISQILLVALGVFFIIGINFSKGGFYRYEKTIPYYEVIWTALPTCILCSVAIPRMCLLYSHEQEIERLLSIKCIGHQWYWRYEYRDFPNVEFDRFILPTRELERGEIRYLEVDNHLVVPINTAIRYIITRDDVIHRWALPTFSIKVDAIGGRLNTINFTITTTGVLLGQCRELCGANHRLIPIVIEATLPLLFKEWLATH